jgi:hypothetical protein
MKFSKISLFARDTQSFDQNERQQNKKSIISGIMKVDSSVSEERTLSRDVMTNTVLKSSYRRGCGENSMNF